MQKTQLECKRSDQLAKLQGSDLLLLVAFVVHLSRAYIHLMFPDIIRSFCLTGLCSPAFRRNHIAAKVGRTKSFKVAWA